MTPFALFVFSAHFVWASALREMINHNMPDMPPDNLDKHKKKVLEGKTVFDFFFCNHYYFVAAKQGNPFPNLEVCTNTPS